MAESSSIRRSGRKRQPNRKYSIDSFEEVQSLSSGSDENETAQKRAESIKRDDEVEDEHENDRDYIVDDGAPNGSGNVSSAAEEDAEDVDIDELPSPSINNRGSNSLDHAPLKEKSLRYQVKPQKDPKNAIRSRGLAELSSKNPSKEDMLKFMAGGYPQDWAEFLKTKDRWLTDPTLPTRADSKRGREGMCYHFSHTAEKRKMEATVGWDWYYDQGGRELFAKRQRTKILTPDEGHGYIPKSLEQSHKFLMGPYGKQQLYRLQIGQSIYLDDAWKSTQENHQKSTQPGESREGWMLNLGTSIKCLEWATNQDGDIQFLTVATAQPKSSQSEGLSEVSPAYTPSAPLRSCIQIWGFAARKTTDHRILLGPRQPPALHLVICTEWGEIKQLKWCQIPRTFRSDDYADKIPLGLLASVWSDGLVRVLDIQLDKNTGITTSYGRCIHSLITSPPNHHSQAITVKYDEPAFKAWAPNTLCTCVTWLSASHLAVGFTNGFLAIWDISQTTLPQSPSSSPSPSNLTPTPTPPRPWLYTSLHQSYILAITSAYPTYPHLLSTTSIDGHSRLTDLRAPSSDSALSPRSRNSSPLLSFSPHTLSMLSTEENDFARLFPLRAFHSSIGFARTSASPLCLAANVFHPCVLIGCADGSLIAANPLPRVWSRKRAYFQQVVFRHEWARGKGGSGGGGGGGGGGEEGGGERGGKGGEGGGGGISRITESYKIMQTDKTKLRPSSTSTSKSKPPRTSSPSQSAAGGGGGRAGGGGSAGISTSSPLPLPPTQTPLTTTIHEPETGLSAVAWNANVAWGGWMAAGTGSGMVRVQDLAV